MGNLTFTTLRRSLKSWRCRRHKVLNARRLWILLMGPVEFAPTIFCSVAMVYLTMATWLLQLCWEHHLGANLGISRVDLAVGWWWLHGVAVLLLAVGGVW